VFDFGTFDGNTSANLATNLGAEADIITIDIGPNQLDAIRLPISNIDLNFVRNELVSDQVDARIFCNYMGTRLNSIFLPGMADTISSLPTPATNMSM
jgi:hypothetical protein